MMQRQELTARVSVHTPPSDRRPKQVPLALSKPPQHRGLHQDSPPRGRTSPVHTTTHVTAPRTLGYTLRRHHERVKDHSPRWEPHPVTESRTLGYTPRWHHKRVKDHSPRSRTLAYTPRWHHKSRDFHLYKSCTGQCGRSHNCPVRVDGWTCDAAPGTHSTSECPHAPK